MGRYAPYYTYKNIKNKGRVAAFVLDDSMCSKARSAFLHKGFIFDKSTNYLNKGDDNLPVHLKKMKFERHKKIKISGLRPLNLFFLCRAVPGGGSPAPLGPPTAAFGGGGSTYMSRKRLV